MKKKKEVKKESKDKIRKSKTGESDKIKSKSGSIRKDSSMEELSDYEGIVSEEDERLTSSNEGKQQSSPRDQEEEKEGGSGERK